MKLKQQVKLLEKRVEQLEDDLIHKVLPKFEHEVPMPQKVSYWDKNYDKFETGSWLYNLFGYIK